MRRILLLALLSAGIVWPDSLLQQYAPGQAGPALRQKILPVAPPGAGQLHITGLVVLEVKASPEGIPVTVIPICGDPSFTPAAISAVRQRRYLPGSVTTVQVRVAR